MSLIPRRYQSNFAFLLLGICLVGYAYFPAYDAPFYFDDEQNIESASSLHWRSLADISVSSLVEVYLPSRVVPNISFGLNHIVTGLDPVGFRVVNVLIHVLTGIMVFCLIRLYLHEFAGVQEMKSNFAAIGLALVFVLHPLNIQSVTYVVQRMAQLAALFGTAAFYAFLRYFICDSCKKRRLWLIATAVLFLAACLSKENATALVLVLLLSAWCLKPKEMRPFPAGRQVTLAILTVMILVVLVVGIIVADRNVFIFMDYWNQPFPGRDFSATERLMTQARIQWLYLYLFAVPLPSSLTLDHQILVSRGLLDPATTLISMIFLSAIVGWLIARVRRDAKLSFPWLAYFILHSIEAGPLPLELMYEHRMYFPMVMLLLGIGVVLCRVWPGQRTVVVPVVVIAGILAVLSNIRNETWADKEMMLIDIAQKAPSSFRPLYNLGTWYGANGKLEMAEFWLERSLGSLPNTSDMHRAESRALVNLGNVKYLKGDHKAAIELYQRATTADRTNPAAWNNLRRFGQ